MKSIGIAISVIVLVVFAFWYEISVWQECLKHELWWYCLRILSK